MKNGGRIHIQDLLSDGETPYERRFRMPSHGSIIPFGAEVEYHPILRRTYRDYINLAKSLARYIPRLCIVCGWNLERRHFGRRH